MIIAVVGPTGVGKTRMSIALAKKYDAEIISCDSMQIYKKMDIGTAKVSKGEMDGVVHHMIDIKEPDEEYSVFDYQKDARKILNSLLEKKKNVVIVGGTGLYLKALLYDYNFKKIEEKKDLSNYTNDELYKKVIAIDPKTKIHVNNRQRLESFLNNHDEENLPKASKKLYDAKIIGLTRPRDELYEAINNRVDEMIHEGLVEEARYFYDNYLTCKALNSAIAYKELFMYFNNDITLEDAIQLIKKRSRNYAKRQYTWFKNQMDVKWFNVLVNDFDKTIKEVINYTDI